MIWNESIECMDRESLRKIQSIRLRKIVEHVYHNTPFYRKKMQELGITPDDINSIDDIGKLPFTTKYDLRDNYPFGLCAVPMSQIVRIHASSGTTGKPTVVGYTRKDLSTWSECLSRAFTAYGADSSDIFQISYGYAAVIQKVFCTNTVFVRSVVPVPRMLLHWRPRHSANLHHATLESLPYNRSLQLSPAPVRLLLFPVSLPAYLLS